VNCQQLAVAAVSRKKQSFSASAIEHLKSKAYTVYSINPNFDENDADLKEFKSFAGLPEDVHHLLVLTIAHRRQLFVNNISLGNRYLSYQCATKLVRVQL